MKACQCMCMCVYACTDTGIDGSVQKCIHINVDLYSVLFLREVFECLRIVTETYKNHHNKNIWVSSFV